ncbi:MAG: hypothetical protein MK085_04020 [Phycisphaerales bacterium]|nr:hypothetical protein [Phycisphaerales bacterium]
MSATLKPFRAQIVTSFQGERPSDLARMAYELYVTSLMQTNQVDAAWELLQETGQDGRKLAQWRSVATSLNYSSARRAIDRLESVLGNSPQDKMATAMNWIVVARKTQNEDAREFAAERVNNLRDPSIRNEQGMVLGPAELLQVELLYAGLQEQDSPIDALESYKSALDMVPQAIRDASVGPEGLTDGQKEQFDQYIGPYIMVLNNYAAVASKLGMELEQAREAVDLAIRMQPGIAELYDTRALVEISAGNASMALKDAQRAIELRPDRLGFRFTLAKAHVEAGNPALAMDLLDDIERQNGLLPVPDLRLQEQVSDFKVEVERRISR